MTDTIKMVSRKLIIFLCLIIGLALSLVIGLILMFSFGSALHNYRMSSYSQAVAETQIKDSKQINSLQRYGILWGNSNHCDSELVVGYSTNLEYKEFASEIEKKIEPINPAFSSGPYVDIYSMKDNEVYYSDNYKILVDPKSYLYSAENFTNTDYFIEKDDYQIIKEMFIQNKNIKYVVTLGSQSFDDLDINTDFRCN